MHQRLRAGNQSPEISRRSPIHKQNLTPEPHPTSHRSPIHKQNLTPEPHPTQHTAKRYKPQNTKNDKRHSLITCKHGHTILDDSPLPFKLKCDIAVYCTAIAFLQGRSSEDDRFQIPDWSRLLRLHLP